MSIMNWNGVGPGGHLLPILSHPSIFTPVDVEEFEREILDNPRATERDASSFFERYPKFLLLGEGKEIREEAVLYNNQGRPVARVDFFRKPYGSSFWDIVELKSPSDLLVAGEHSKHPRLAAAVHKAISQAQDYRCVLEEDAELRADLASRGISVLRPRLIIVVGREKPDISPETLKVLYDRARQGPVEVRSYTSLYRFAREHCQATRIVVIFTGIASVGKLGFGPRRLHIVICSECGAETHVPFRPLPGRPTYCRDCYAKLSKA